MAKEGGKARQKRRKKRQKANGFELKPSSYQPTKAELEEDLSVPVDLETLGRAAVQGGVPRRT